MKKAKIIVIEGSDCSGKETQSQKLIERLKSNGKKVAYFSFPNYEVETGKIIGGPLLGIPSIGKSYFKDISSLDPYVTSLYYAADRRFHLGSLNYAIENNDYIILNRYTSSSMAHQGSKINDKSSRKKFYQDIEYLEYEILKLPKPDKIFFLYVPIEISCDLLKQRGDLDKDEKNRKHLQKSLEIYQELAEIYHYCVINCIFKNQLRNIEDIHNEIYKEIIREEALK